jgi:hypothetical protein
VADVTGANVTDADVNESQPGLGAMNDRMARARRSVAPPRRTPPAQAAPADEQGSATAPRTPAELPAKTANQATKPGKPTQGRPPRETTPPPLTAMFEPDEPQANLAVRVRRSLDLRLDHLIHELRHQHAVRSSKTELVEMLLSELPRELDDDLLVRLSHYRQAARRP